MWLLIPTLWKLPFALILWIGKPFVRHEGNSSYRRTRNEDNMGIVDFYVLRWVAVIPGCILGIVAITIVLYYIPWVIALLLLATGIIDGIMIGFRALWVRDAIKKSTGTDIVVADLWKDKVGR